MGKKDITQLEIRRLPETFNLTDGHAHRNPIGDESVIIERMSGQFLAADREKQGQFEEEYLKAYYALTGQTIDRENVKYMLLPTASLSLEIIANYLRAANLSLALTEPCFDNLVNMFKRHDVKIKPIPDKFLANNIQDFLPSIESDAICVVSPNNPTGIYYTKNNFEALVSFCKDHGKLLIVDSSFRPYRPRNEIFDEYALLIKSGIDFIFVEDSGKTWPTRELKVSILAASSRISQTVYDIYTDLVYHHSPFTVSFVAQFVQGSIADDLQVVHGLIERNRQSLRNAVEGTCLEFADQPHASLAWLRITNNYTGAQLQKEFARQGVYIVPGECFFWSDKSKGDKFIRISLVRDEQLFQEAARKIRECLLGLS